MEPDRLGFMVVVQLFGLLLSPISWTHHWVWLVPLMIWLVHGPYRYLRGSACCWAWPGWRSRLTGVPWLLSFAEPEHLADQPAVVPGLGGPGLPGGRGGHATVDRHGTGQAPGRPTMASISPAIATSLSVMPPAECVTSAKVTVRQRMSISG